MGRGKKTDGELLSPQGDAHRPINPIWIHIRSYYNIIYDYMGWMTIAIPICSMVLEYLPKLGHIWGVNVGIHRTFGDHEF